MANNDKPVWVVAADPNKGNLIIHFSDGTSFLFHARFLFEARARHGNIALPDTLEENGDCE